MRAWCKPGSLFAYMTLKLRNVSELEMTNLIRLTRDDTTDDPYTVTERNIEVACGYALRVTRKWSGRITEWMDPACFEECAIGAVLDAAQRYDPSYKASFFTYAMAKVKGALQEEDRKQRRRGPSYQLNEVWKNGHRWNPEKGSYRGQQKDYERQDFNTDSELPLESEESVEGNVVSPAFIDFILGDLAKQAGLTDREIAILRMRYVDDVMQKDIAAHFNVTPGRIHQIEDAALKKLRAPAIIQQLT